MPYILAAKMRILTWVVMAASLGCDSANRSQVTRDYSIKPIQLIAQGGAFIHFDNSGEFLVCEQAVRSTKGGWNVVGSISGDAGRILSMAVSDDATRCAVGYVGGRVAVYSLPDWSLVADGINNGAAVLSLCFVDNGTAFFAVETLGKVTRFSTETGAEAEGGFAEDLSRDDSIRAAAFSPSKKLVAKVIQRMRMESTSGGGFAVYQDAERIEVHSTVDGSLVKTFQLDAKDAIYKLAFSPDEDFVLAGVDPGVIIYSLQNDDPVIRLATAANVRADDLRFSTDGTNLLAAYTNPHNQNGIIQFFNWADRKSIGCFVAHKRGVTSLAMSPEGKLLATSGADANISQLDIHIWDTEERMQHLYQALPPRH